MVQMQPPSAKPVASGRDSYRHHDRFGCLRTVPEFGDLMTVAELSTTATPTVRDAGAADMRAIQAIYAHYVLNGIATFEEIPPSVDDMIARRASVLEAGLPYLVAESEGRIVGYSYATSYRPRPAYRHTIEDSVYIADSLVGRGIGTMLLGALILRCEAGPWRQMLAVIGNSGNTGSIALHRRMGFGPIGTLSAVGFKLGQWVDTVLMQRALGEGAASLPTANGKTAKW
jgi:L-amino acid N-acyltransferase YncA